MFDTDQHAVITNTKMQLVCCLTILFTKQNLLLNL